MDSLIEILDKKTKEIILEDFVETWMNPRSSIIDKTGLKPTSFNQAYTMLVDMLNGEIFQNLKYAVRLKGVNHKWDWIK